MLISAPSLLGQVFNVFSAEVVSQHPAEPLPATVCCSGGELTDQLLASATGNAAITVNNVIKFVNLENPTCFSSIHKSVLLRESRYFASRGEEF
ncbi:hypothetical protein Zmor_005687 [Zophobas morio]|uniref:Uncharacterized protein n=1 Tax=Zophobas morio TaxID=2755281 RepID=A0AA38ISG4_9CUCU|nr:hypothetical protein Zmor_005687 [Zophobas morio]